MIQEECCMNIDNRKTWVVVKDELMNRLHVTADENECLECGNNDWTIATCLISGSEESKTCLCLKCFADSTVKVQKRYCPCCSKNARSLRMHICQDCVESVIKNTKELYRVCTVPDKACSCKYCKVLGRC